MTRTHRRTTDERLYAAAPDAVSSEGAPIAAAATRAPADSALAAMPDTDRGLLERLGAALLAEWIELPMPVQRAIYCRAVGAMPASEGAGGLAGDAAALKRRMASFLHDRHGPARHEQLALE